MAQYTPLQLTVLSALMQNQGLNQLPSALTTAIANYNATTVISNWIAAVDWYKKQNFFTETTLDLLLSIGSGVCPALGNSIPTTPLGTFANLITEYLTYNTVTDTSTIDPSGFSLLIEQTGSAYLGNGDASKFAQGFSGVQSFVESTNTVIASSTNANTYLGPTFTNMDSLVTSGLTDVNSDFDAFGTDLANQGQLVNPKNITNFGTPAALLQQLAKVGNMLNGTLPGVQTALNLAGLTDKDIADLVNNNIQSLFNPNGLSSYEFDKLQQKAYTGMTNVVGSDLTNVLVVLAVTTPNVMTMADLLNPAVMFPNSYTSFTTPGPYGPVPVYQNNTGTVNAVIQPLVDANLPSASGCEELGKIIPPDQAVANKALQVAFQQISGGSNTTWPRLAETIKGYTRRLWNNSIEYYANDIVSYNEPIPTFYQAQQDVPAGINISDTGYWLPTTLGGLNTMTGLPLIQAQTSAVDTSVTDYFSTNVATGSGSDGTITIEDVIGLAIDSDDFAARFTDVADIIDGLGTGLDDLSQIYIDMLSSANDAAVITLIANASAEIASINSVHPAQVETMNTDWVAIATALNQEVGYQNSAGVDYFALQPNLSTSVQSFVQNLHRYGRQTAPGMSAEFLTAVANTATLGGQAIVGSLREGQNLARLGAGRLNTNGSNIPNNLPVTPISAVTPAV
jgi:hypothetical protein